MNRGLPVLGVVLTKRIAASGDENVNDQQTFRLILLPAICNAFITFESRSSRQARAVRNEDSRCEIASAGSILRIKLNCKVNYFVQKFLK